MAPDGPEDDFTSDIEAIKRENESLKAALEESRRSVKCLQETLARYMDVAESMPEWFWEVDDRFRFTYCSDKVKSILGYAPEEMIGRTPLDFIRDDEKPKLARVAESVFASRSPFHDVVTWGSTRGGEPICSMASGVPFFDADGTFRGYRGVNEDITLRVRTEEALRENERKFRSIVEESRDGIILVDEQGVVIEWNRGIEQILGIPAEETIGHPFWEIMPPASPKEGELRDNREHLEEVIRTTLSAGDAPWLKKPLEFSVKRPDGDTRFIQQVVFPIRTDRGWMLGSISRDVTEERKAEQVLRESEARFHDLAESLPQTVFETDLTGRLTFVNTHSFVMFGYTREDFDRGINVFQTIAPDDLDRARANFRKDIDGIGPIPTEYLAIRKDGSTFPMLVTSSVILKNGSPVGLRGVIVDITEQKQTEMLAGKIRDLALFLGSTHDLDAGLSACLRVAGELSGAEYCGIYLMESSGALRLVVSEGLDREFFTRASYFPPESPNTHIVMRGSPVYTRIDEISADLAHMAERVGIQNIAVIPFLHDGRAIGALIIGYGTADSLSGLVRGLLEGLVAQIGNSIGRLRMETALRESEEKYRTLVENATDIITRHDREYRHLYVSPAIRNAVALDPADFIGRTNREISTAPMDIDAWESRLEKVFATGRAISETVEFQGLSGKMVFDALLVPERGSDGEVKSVLSIFRDITDRVTAQEALYLSESRFLFIANQLPGTLWTTDRDLKITLALGRGLAELKLTPNLVTGMTVGEFFETDDPNDIALSMHHRTLGGEASSYCHRWGDRYYDTMLEPLRNSSGDIEGVLGIALDVTEREKEKERAARLEKQFLQSQKMEIIGRFAGGIAHDFNNILTVINAHAEISLMSLNPDDQFHEAFSEIKRSGERAAEMTRRILSFSRREIVEPRIINCNSILLDMDKMLRRLIGENIELVTIPDETLLPVHIDPGQFEQVLINLVVNARDAMPKGGTLTIETKSVMLDEEYARHHAGVVPGHYSMFSVTDTGIGMDEETLSHVFEPFYTTKPMGYGTGLGLSTCYGIVKQNNGSIWMYSEPGRGTSVKVYLPAVEGMAGAAEDAGKAAEFPVGNESVLVVEDDSGIRNLIVRLLTSVGYQVTHASNGDEALKVVRSRLDKFDLVITDIVMPLMGGPELVDQISLIHPGTPVLFMSGYTDNSIPLHGVDGTEFKFIQKPFSTGVFMRKVREILDSAG